MAIHDWHAEVLAIRTLNRFLLDECQGIIDSSPGGSETILQRTDERIEGYTRPFRVKDDVKLHMYCSEAPCELFLPLLSFFFLSFTTIIQHNEPLFSGHKKITSLTNSF